MTLAGGRIRNRRTVFVLLVTAATSQAAHSASGDGAVRIVPNQRWTNHFGGTRAKLTFVVESDQPVDGRFAWRFEANQRTIARGEQAFESMPDQSAEVTVPLAVPPVNDGVIFRAQFNTTVIDADANTSIAEFQTPIWIFPRDPLVDRRQWIDDLDLALYDPQGKTQRLFDQLQLSCKRLGNLAAIEGFDGATLIVGEGASLKGQSELVRIVAAKAASGLSVLWLAPAQVDMPWSSLAAGETLRRQDWRQSEVIGQLDKRLDGEFWPSANRVAASRFRLVADRSQLRLQTTDDEPGWPWIDLHYKQHGGRMIVCGFALVQSWADGPTPRYLLLRILEELQTTSGR